MLKFVQVNSLMEFLFASILSQYLHLLRKNTLYQIEQKHTIFHSHFSLVSCLKLIHFLVLMCISHRQTRTLCSSTTTAVDLWFSCWFLFWWYTCIFNSFAEGNIEVLAKSYRIYFLLKGVHKMFIFEKCRSLLKIKNINKCKALLKAFDKGRRCREVKVISCSSKYFNR